MSTSENPKPDKSKFKDLKPMDLDRFGSTFKTAAKKGVSLFEKTKAALKGDGAAKQELSDDAARVVVKARDALERTGDLAADIKAKAQKKLQERKPK